MNFKDTIGVYPSAFSNDLCDSILKLYNDYSNYTFEGRTVIGVRKDVKNSTDLNIHQVANMDKKVIPLVVKINDQLKACSEQYLNSFPNQNIFPAKLSFGGNMGFTVMQVQKYKKNEGHYNNWHHEGSTGTSRILALLLYLNDVKKGGETEFLYGDKIKPQKGKLLIHPAGFPYIHKGNVPLSSDKIIMISWLCFKEQ